MSHLSALLASIFSKPTPPPPATPIGTPISPTFPPIQGVSDPKFLINAPGLALVKAFEGLSLTAYKDSVGVWTIGYGRIIYPSGAKVQMGDMCAVDQANEWLLSDLEGEGAHYVRAWASPSTLNENQFSALTSFTYNRGAGRLRELITSNPHLPWPGFLADEMLKYDWAMENGERKVLPGLARRRRAERFLFLGDIKNMQKEIDS